MSKQSNSTPEKSSKPAASGSGGSGASKSETRKISNASLSGKHVGPKSAPYHEK